MVAALVMWVRWRNYRNGRAMRWHRLEPDERRRTLCGRKVGRHDFMETSDQVKAHDRCAHCERARRPGAG